MRKAIFLFVFFFFGMSIVTVGFLTEEVGAAPKILLKAVTGWPVTHVGNDYYKEFIKRVNDRAKGEMEIKLLGGPEIVSTFDQLKALSTEVVDVVHAAQSYYAGIVPEGTVVDLLLPHELVPYLRESGVWDSYVQAYVEKAKAVFLGNVWIGMPFYLMTNKPVSKLEDVRGLKIRGLGGLLDILAGEMGTSVVRLASAEVYEGLQRGIVDGAIRNTISLVEFKEYEVLKYVIFPPFCTSSGAVWVGEKKWNTLPKPLQNMMKEVMVETERDALKYYGNMDKDRLKEVQEKHGMKVVYLTKEDIAKFNKIRLSPAIKDWVYKKAPKFGPLVYDKVVPYIK